MTKYFIQRLSLSVLAGIAWGLSACGNDDDSPDTPNPQFAGTYRLLSATTAGGVNILDVVSNVLLSESPCDTANTNDEPLIEFALGANNNAGNINAVCSISSSSATQGTWQFTAPQGPLDLTFNIDASPVPIPVVFNSLNLTLDGATGKVANITGPVDFSLFALLPEVQQLGLDLSQPVTLSLDAVD
ncbi:MAG: hypothetical protein HC880_20285 [Bacteroidia bacterium]|nr:hypothetical protein [Bacteroidia bacterium]